VGVSTPFSAATPVCSNTTMCPFCGACHCCRRGRRSCHNSPALCTAAALGHCHCCMLCAVLWPPLSSVHAALATCCRRLLLLCETKESCTFKLVPLTLARSDHFSPLDQVCLVNQQTLYKVRDSKTSGPCCLKILLQLCASGRGGSTALPSTTAATTQIDFDT